MMMAYTRVVAVAMERLEVLRTDSGRPLESGIDRPRWYLWGKDYCISLLFFPTSIAALLQPILHSAVIKQKYTTLYLQL